VAREKKRELLSYLIQTRDLKQVLVFSGTRIGANRLAHQLRKDHIHADAIHGDKTQAEREVALQDFKAGKTAVLVATDVASRGLDIEGLPQVINFDIPRSPEDYVHRIGRTGRAGTAGEAISLVSPEDHESLAAIERLIKKKIEKVLVPSFQPSTGSVATLMGGEASRPRRGREGERESSRREREPRRERERDRAPQQHAPRREPAARQPADPIFSKPYEPTQSAPQAASEPKPENTHGKRKRPQVAALLGGKR
jgi:ATP-dependent RNA helicase RhlE